MATILGMMHLDLHIPQANSLKEKRRIVKGFKDRTISRFNVSVSEVDFQDRHRRSKIAIAAVGSDKQYVEGMLDKITKTAMQHRDMVLINRSLEWFFE